MVTFVLWTATLYQLDDRMCLIHYWNLYIVFHVTAIILRKCYLVLEQCYCGWFDCLVACPHCLLQCSLCRRKPLSLRLGLFLSKFHISNRRWQIDVVDELFKIIKYGIPWHWQVQIYHLCHPFSSRKIFQKALLPLPLLSPLNVCQQEEGLSHQHSFTWFRSFRCYKFVIVRWTCCSSETHIQISGLGIKLLLCHDYMLLAETITHGANMLSASSVTQGITAAGHLYWQVQVIPHYDSLNISGSLSRHWEAQWIVWWSRRVLLQALPIRHQ